METCDACGHQGFRTFDRHPHLGIWLTYVVCRYCGLVFMSPRFEGSDLERFYQAEYRRLYSGSEQPTRSQMAQQQTRADHLAQLLDQHVGEVTEHLDIGASAGKLMQSVLSKNGRVHSVGIEPSEKHRAHCRREGLSVYASIQHLLREEADRFQVVTLSHVLEHIPDPVDYLRALRTKVLRPHGHLLIEVPNLYGHVSYEIAHLYCFSPKTLADICGRAGFRVTFQKIHSVTRQHSRGRHYLTILAKPDAQAVHRRIDRTWWRLVQLQRIRGLSGRSWADLALRAIFRPRKAVELIAKTFGRSSESR